MPDPGPVSRRPIYRGAKFDFEELQWESPGGRTIRRQVVRHPGAAVILPILSDGRLVLVRNFRPSVGMRLLELPAGTLEGGETPRDCAERELIEETGYRAATIRPLGRFYTSPGLSDELMHAFVATGLEHVGQTPEDDEDLEVVALEAGAAMELIERGELLDGKSILALVLAAREGLLRPGETGGDAA